MPNEFPNEIEQFLQQQIESLGQLEALLLLKQDEQRLWDSAELSKALYTSADVCAGLLADLERRGLLGVTATAPLRYRYQPADEKLRRVVDQLDTIYQQRRVAVVTKIYSKPVGKVQTFADSFRLRRETET